MHGWIILDKPLGLTSEQGVAAIKRLLKPPRGVKVGHGGTLDPLATGVLPIALGEATKLTGRMLNGDKGYRFTVAFGASTATDDLEGAVVATHPHRPTQAAVEAVLPLFRGEIEQTPPAYSALKVDGARAYDLARAGEAVALAARRVTIHALTLEDTTPMDGHLDAATFSVRCSKGTYVRALARDLALALGTLGHVTHLRRTLAGPFTLDHAIELDKLRELVQTRPSAELIAPLTTALDDIPALAVTPEQAAMLRCGQRLVGFPVAPGSYVAIEAKVPVALVEAVATPDGRATVSVTRGFNL